MHRQVHLEYEYVCATWRNVIINNWAGEITHEALAAGRDAGERLEAEYGPNIGALTIVSVRMPSPSDSVRKQAAIDMKSAGHRLSAAATVIVGSGFRASAFRSAYATINLFARTNHPSKVVKEIEDGAAFIVDTLEFEAGAVPELCEVVEFYAQALNEYRADPQHAPVEFS